MYKVDMPYICIDNRNNNIILPIILYKKNVTQKKDKGIKTKTLSL